MSPISELSLTRDPSAPKKPLSAYFMFLSHIRSNPHLVKEIFGDEQETTRQSSLAAQYWREMTDEGRRVRHVRLSVHMGYVLMGVRSPSWPRRRRTSWSTRPRVVSTRRGPRPRVRTSTSASFSRARRLVRSASSRRVKARVLALTEAVASATTDRWIVVSAYFPFAILMSFSFFDDDLVYRVPIRSSPLNL